MQHRSRLAALATTFALFAAAGATHAAPRPPCDVAGACDEIGGEMTPTLREGGRYHVTSTLVIGSGTTLTIPAGAALYFDPGTTLDVGLNGGGRIVVEGTPERPVLLTSASLNPRPRDWNGLLLRGGTGNVVRNAQIEFAETAVRALSSDVEISDSRITQVGRDAISVEGDFNARITGNTLISGVRTAPTGINVSHISDMPVRLEVRDNTIQGFGAGIQMFAVTSASIEITENRLQSNTAGVVVSSVGFGRVTGAPEVFDNMIEGNDEGIFIYGGAPRIERNMIVDNTCLAIYINSLEDDLGFSPVITGNTILRNRGGCVGVRDLTIVHDASFGSVDIRQNYWGPTNIDEVAELIRDGNDVPGRALARVCPIANANGARINCTDPRPR